MNVQVTAIYSDAKVVLVALPYVAQLSGLPGSHNAGQVTHRWSTGLLISPSQTRAYHIHVPGRDQSPQSRHLESHLQGSETRFRQQQ